MSSSLPHCLSLSGMLCVATVLLLAGSAQGQAAGSAGTLGPAPGSGLDLAAPITRWDEAIPLGNGLLGGLLWGEGDTLRLSLDRGDLWDLRRPEIVQQPDWTYANIKKRAAEGNQAEISRLFDAPYNDIPYPTKLPVAQVELTFGGMGAVQRFGLNLQEATGTAAFEKGVATALFHATEPVALLHIAGSAPECRIVPSTAVKQLGYTEPETGRDGDYFWSLQGTLSDLKYAVVLKIARAAGSTDIALTVTSTADGQDPVAVGKARVDAALATGYEKLRASHAHWWADFWSASGVRVPDPAIQAQYDLVQYFYGAASRRGAPPIPLQGVWTADEGNLPPWKGDYHHDLNTQLTYWAYLAAGHFEEGLSFLDFMFNLLPAHRDFAKTFYGAPGAAVPGVMTLDGKALAGWAQYSLSPTNGAWVAQAFYWHWRYTMDRQFLEERAYPYLEALGECYEGLLEPDAAGKLKLPLSSSPEIHDNTIRAWLRPNSNFDLALLRWHFGALAEMADALGNTAAAKRWRGLLGRLDDFAVEPDTLALRLSPEESLTESHRHHSQLMAIHPLGLISVEGTERERGIIEGSLAQEARLGTRNWCGYSFSWMSCLAARAGRADLALDQLATFVKAFISRNGFHLNGDQTGGTYSNFTYRPFTLEGNFAAAQAVHEMLLQSWGGVVRAFPAVVEAWPDASFDRLRAEGGFIVSAQREGGKTLSVRIEATVPGTLRLRDPFGGRPAAWSRPDVKREGADWVCTLESGAVLEGRLAP